MRQSITWVSLSNSHQQGAIANVIEKKVITLAKKFTNINLYGTQILYFTPTIFWLEYLSLAEKTLTLKAYNKIERATDIINYSLSEKRSIFNASQLLKFSNVTGCFTACIGVHSPAVEWITWSGLDFDLALFRGCQGLVAQLQILQWFHSSFPSKHIRAWSVASTPT